MSAQPFSRHPRATPATTCSATSGDKRGRQVIEEEERLGALHEDVVDAVVDQVRSDGVVPVRHERDLELGAHAIGARHEHRLAVAVGVETKEAAKGPDLGQHTGRGSWTARAP